MNTNLVCEKCGANSGIPVQIYYAKATTFERGTGAFRKIITTYSDVRSVDVVICDDCGQRYARRQSLIALIFGIILIPVMLLVIANASPIVQIICPALYGFGILVGFVLYIGNRRSTHEAIRESYRKSVAVEVKKASLSFQGYNYIAPYKISSKAQDQKE